MDDSVHRAPSAPPLPATPSRFIAYFIARFRRWYVAMIVLETINSTCGILIPYATGQIIKAVTRAHEQSLSMVAQLSGPLWLFIALAIGEVVFSRAGGACQIYIGPRQRQAVTRAMYAYLQHHSHRFLSSDFAGSLAHKISETAMGYSQTIWTLIFDFYPMVIVFGVAIFMLERAHKGLAEFVAIWAACFVSASFWLATRTRPFAVAAAAARSETTGRVVDAVTNLTSTRLFARLDYEREYLDAQLGKELRAVMKSNTYSERVRWFQYSAAAVLKIGVLYYALLLWGRGEISVADFVVAVTTTLLIINEARNLSRRFLEFFEYLGNIANGVHTIIRPHEIVDVPGAVRKAIERGRIEFRDVSFAYAAEQPIFQHLNVTIPAGQRLGLVGFSGSGKSTFVSLILRLYDPQAGRILIDGQDIGAMTQDSLHSQLSLIPQDPNLFHRSLLENIRYGRLEATDEEVVGAARKAHAHEFITKIKDQYASLVGERGVKLSGGQRQRIAIARVVVKNAPILILDEGRSVEDGTHEELLALRGAYHQLWSRQAGGFVLDDGAADESVKEEEPLGTAETPEE